MQSLAVMNPQRSFNRKGWAMGKFQVRFMGLTSVIHYIGRSKYWPHSGAKEAVRHAGKTALGFNASRALVLKEPQAAALTVESPFAVGQVVRWTSSNTDKIGAIVAVVPAGKSPSDVGVKLKDVGMARDHVSYIVEGQQADRDGNPTGRKSKYWPRVSLLEIA